MAENKKPSYFDEITRQEAKQSTYAHIYGPKTGRYKAGSNFPIQSQNTTPLLEDKMAEQTLEETKKLILEINEALLTSVSFVNKDTEVSGRIIEDSLINNIADAVEILKSLVLKYNKLIIDEDNPIKDS